MKKHIEMYKYDINNTKYIIKCAVTYLSLVKHVNFVSHTSSLVFKREKNIFKTKK